MLTQISISHPAFGQEPLVLRELKPATFIYGSNGSGKTTLSRCLRRWGVGEFDGVHCEPQIEAMFAVFNRDYIQETLAKESLDGVFVMADDAADLQKRKKQLEGRIEKMRTSWQDCRNKKSDAEFDIKRARETLATKIWELRKARFTAITSQGFSDIFTGTNQAKNALLEKVLAADLPASGEAASLDDIQQRINMTMEEDKTRRPLVAQLPVFGLSDQALNELLRSVPEYADGSAEKDIPSSPELIDWIMQGLAHYETAASGACPFCNQALPNDKVAGLKQLLGSDWSRVADDARAAIKDLRRWELSLHESLARIEAEGADDLRNDELQAFRLTASALRESLRANISAMERKVTSPARPAEARPMAEYARSINQFVDKVNHRIGQRNNLRANAARERLRLRGEAYAYLKCASQSDYKIFKVAEKSGARKISESETGMRELEAKIDAHEKQLADILERLASSAETARRINSMLKAVGFDNFVLAKASSGDGYILVRQDQSMASSSLSEGEATFVALLYFIHQVRSWSEDNGAGAAPIVAIVDDPVSSLDSGIAHFAAVLLKDLARTARVDGGRLGQVIILTHNVFFYRQVATNLPDELSEYRSFGTLRRAGLARAYQAHEHFPMRSAYAALWAEVPREDEVSGPLPATTQNAMRRIVETYFTSFGKGFGISSAYSHFKGEQLTQFASLTSWLHAGSHAIYDDFEYNSTEEDARMFSRTFRELFELTNNLGHYEMMMANRGE